MKEYIYGHTSFENAYEVENYPWGFRLRTKVRYWIETNHKKTGGQRFCKCTLNPKTGDWCKPKKRTYAILVNLYLDEKEYVQIEEMDGYTAEPQAIIDHIKIHKAYLSEYEKKALQYFIARNEVMKNVEYEFKAVDPFEDEGTRKERKEKSEKNEALIRSAINHKSKGVKI